MQSTACRRKASVLQRGAEQLQEEIAVLEQARASVKAEIVLYEAAPGTSLIPIRRVKRRSQHLVAPRAARARPGRPNRLEARRRRARSRSRSGRRASRPGPTTALTAASTIAPPIWNEVCTSPDARPCSWSATPSVACMFSAG